MNKQYKVLNNTVEHPTRCNNNFTYCISICQRHYLSVTLTVCYTVHRTLTFIQYFTGQRDMCKVTQYISVPDRSEARPTCRPPRGAGRRGLARSVSTHRPAPPPPPPARRRSLSSGLSSVGCSRDRSQDFSSRRQELMISISTPRERMPSCYVTLLSVHTRYDPR